MARASARSLWTSKILNQTAPKKPAAADISKLTNKKPFEGFILGIDPSLRGTGIALLEFKKGNRVPHLEYSHTIKLKPNLSMPECLGQISRTIDTIAETYTIHHVAIEQTIHVQNFQVAQTMGASRGAAIGVLASRGLPIFEYPPLRIKQAVVGFGRASKEQVAKTLMHLLAHTAPLPSDEADAAGVAFCHAMSYVSID